MTQSFVMHSHGLIYGYVMACLTAGSNLLCKQSHLWYWLQVREYNSRRSYSRSPSRSPYYSRSWSRSRSRSLSGSYSSRSRRYGLIADGGCTFHKIPNMFELITVVSAAFLRGEDIHVALLLSLRLGLILILGLYHLAVLSQGIAKTSSLFKFV